MIAGSPAMQEIFRTIRKVAGTDANILITGENGTGKELVARALHKLSPRENQPFVTVDMGAIPESLFESELFGHKKGAFTDAKDERIGKFQLANGGTLFLDEIGNLNLSLQAKLLNALQTRSITPVGSGVPVPIQVRLVSATNTHPGKMVEEKLFRQDLLYRINTIEIKLPPLRERKEDIPPIARYYAEQYSRKYRSEPVTISDAAMQKLLQHPWPGNIRELQHAIERAVILCESFEIRPADFIFQEAEMETVIPAHINLEEMEKQAIYNAIKKHEGNLTQAARELGLGRTTLYRKMEKYGL
jgi:DNA-binding NtrC family response regulator